MLLVLGLALTIILVEIRVPAVATPDLRIIEDREASGLASRSPREAGADLAPRPVDSLPLGSSTQLGPEEVRSALPKKPANLWAADVDALLERMAEFEASPDIIRGGSLIKFTVVTWCDFNGTSVPFEKQDQRELVVDETRAFLSIADTLGHRFCRWTVDEFPEWWELQEFERAKEPFTVPRLPSDLRLRIVERAHTVLRLAQQD